MSEVRDKPRKLSRAAVLLLISTAFFFLMVSLPVLIR
jgi:hypothetical protein